MTRVKVPERAAQMGEERRLQAPKYAIYWSTARKILTCSISSGGAMDAASIIQNFIRSVPGSAGGHGSQNAQQKLFTTLQDLLTPTSTVAWIDAASEGTVDEVLQFLPPNLASLMNDDDGDSATPALSLNQKKDLVRRVLRSPQFSQSLASLTFALRDGGLPSIGEALNVPLQNGGYMRRGGVPLGGGEAVEAFLNGVKTLIEEDADENDEMETN